MLRAACALCLKKLMEHIFFEGRENYNVAFRIVLVGGGGSFVFTLMVSKSNMQQNKKHLHVSLLNFFLPKKHSQKVAFTYM